MTASNLPQEPGEKPRALPGPDLPCGDKAWDRYPPYRELGYAAAATAATEFALGSVGAGLGATTVNLKGGIGSASVTTRDGKVGALAAVNAAGSVVIGNGPCFWAAAFERKREFGGRGLPSPMPDDALTFRAWLIVTWHVGVEPEQSPDQPVNCCPLRPAAVRVTTVPDP